MKNLLPNRTFYSLKCLMLMACEFLFIGNFHIYWKLPHPVEKLYPYVDYKIRKISKDTLVIGDYTDFVFVNGHGNAPNRELSK